MELTLVSVALLLLVAAVVAMLARRLHLPYTVGLVLAGLALAFLPRFSEITLTGDLIFTLFLPPLVFEAALYMRWHDLRRDLVVILSLATLGVLITATITALGMVYLARWTWPAATLLGTLIAATDPVTVIALFKEAGVRGRLRLLVEAESLFNDGTTAVLFGLVMGVLAGQTSNPLLAIQDLLTTVGIGLLCGALVGGGILLLAGRTEDHLVEITLTVIAAYGSFLMANYFQGSGVLASLTAGLLIGNLGALGSISARGREAVESFWEFTAFLVNSLIFILIGMREAHQDLFHTLGPIALASTLVLLGRAFSVYSLAALFAPTPLHIKPAHQHILFWGGMRGTLALALALSLPTGVPDREAVVTVAFGVVAFSIFVQGLTIIPLVRRLVGLPHHPPHAHNTPSSPTAG
ncbi:sodium:proton antiporter [Thermanaerothrix sp. 4228-RoL]|uniref:Sodium:proton antiporter n=2 Tax=Thermanaerothrix TaxID=1077886 RepID=A0ABU3NN16_9CHLR|nr:sodium:proton antiporter [Thermanaerothrix sp. 4228-RoL]MDT8898222.1 sodium:proton antiporter [Thermanaerothrix sp. 4228-RoL]